MLTGTDAIAAAIGDLPVGTCAARRRHRGHSGRYGARAADGWGTVDCGQAPTPQCDLQVGESAALPHRRTRGSQLALASRIPAVARAPPGARTWRTALTGRAGSRSRSARSGRACFHPPPGTTACAPRPGRSPARSRFLGAPGRRGSARARPARPARAADRGEPAYRPAGQPADLAVAGRRMGGGVGNSVGARGHRSPRRPSALGDVVHGRRRNSHLRGAGTPYRPDGAPRRSRSSSPDCGHTYRRSSAAQPGTHVRGLGDRALDGHLVGRGAVRHVPRADHDRHRAVPSRRVAGPQHRDQLADARYPRHALAARRIGRSTMLTGHDDVHQPATRPSRPATNGSTQSAACRARSVPASCARAPACQLVHRRCRVLVARRRRPTPGAGARPPGRPGPDHPGGRPRARSTLPSTARWMRYRRAKRRRSSAGPSRPACRPVSCCPAACSARPGYLRTAARSPRWLSNLARSRRTSARASHVLVVLAADPDTTSGAVLARGLARRRRRRDQGRERQQPGRVGRAERRRRPARRRRPGRPAVCRAGAGR